MGLNKKDFLQASLIVVLFLAFIVAWLAFGERGFLHLYRMEKERREYIDRIRKLEADNRELMDQIKRLREDEDYIESVARKELGMVRDNEVIYRFREDENK